MVLEGAHVRLEPLRPDPLDALRAVNTEAKRLMLAHAFETGSCVRVELETDALDRRSLAAMRRLGATEGGTLRRHRVTAGGRLRDTVYFSIVDAEWPVLRDRLDARLARG